MNDKAIEKRKARDRAYGRKWYAEHREERALRHKMTYIPKAPLTHCKKGHEYTPENTRMYSGFRSCVICQREKSRRNYKKTWKKGGIWFENRRRKRLETLGWTPEAYDAAKIEQGNLCAICIKPCVTGKALAADHDHITGKRRELLCVNCNSALGSFFDDTALLELAIVYLKKHSSNAEQRASFKTAAA